MRKGITTLQFEKWRSARDYIKTCPMSADYCATQIMWTSFMLFLAYCFAIFFLAR